MGIELGNLTSMFSKRDKGTKPAEAATPEPEPTPEVVEPVVFPGDEGAAAVTAEPETVEPVVEEGEEDIEHALSALRESAKQATATQLESKDDGDAIVEDEKEAKEFGLPPFADWQLNNSAKANKLYNKSGEVIKIGYNGSAEQKVQSLFDDAVLKARFIKMNEGRSYAPGHWEKFLESGDIEQKLARTPKLTDAELLVVAGDVKEEFLDESGIEDKDLSFGKFLNTLVDKVEQDSNGNTKDGDSTQELTNDSSLEEVNVVKETAEVLTEDDTPPEDEVEAIPVVDLQQRITDALALVEQEGDGLREDELFSLDQLTRLLSENEIPALLSAQEKVLEEEEGLVEDLTQQTEALAEVTQQIDELQENLAEIRTGDRFDALVIEELENDDVQDDEDGALSWFQKRSKKRKENKTTRIARAKGAGGEFSQRLFTSVYNKMDDGDKDASRRLKERQEKLKMDGKFAAGGLLTALAGPIVTLVGGTGASLYGFGKGSWDSLRGTATLLNKVIDKSGIVFADTALEISGEGRHQTAKVAAKALGGVMGTPEGKEAIEAQGFVKGDQINALLEQNAQLIQMMMEDRAKNSENSDS